MSETAAPPPDDTLALAPLQGPQFAAAPRAPAPLGFLGAVGEGLRTDSPTVRFVEDAGRRLLAWGVLKPERVEGYSPYSDPMLADYMTANPDTRDLFLSADSPDEGAFILARTRALKERAARVEEEGGMLSGFVAGMLSPENLVTLPLAFGGVGFAAAAARGAAGNAALAGAENLANRSSLPDSLQGNFLMETALGGVFGGLLSGAAAGLTRGNLDRALARHAAVNDALDGQRTPGVDRAAAADAVAARGTRTEVTAGLEPQDVGLPRDVVPAPVPTPDELAVRTPAADEPAPPDPGRVVVGAGYVADPRVQGLVEEFVGRLFPGRTVRLRGLNDAERASGNDVRGYASHAGAGRQTDGADFEVALGDLDWRATNSVRTVLHELGHVAEWDRLRSAPRADQDAVRAQFEAERARGDYAVATERATVLDSMKGGEGPEAKTIPTDRPEAVDWADYAEGYSEWFAEKFAKWAATKDPPNSAIERFFERAAKQLRVAYQTAARRLGFEFPQGAFERFMDDAWAGRAAIDTDQRARSMQSPDEMRAAASRDLPADAAEPRASRVENVGLNKLLGSTGQFPWWRMVENRMVGPTGERWALFASEVVQVPGVRMIGNKGEAASTTDSIESRARQIMSRYATVQQAEMEAWFTHSGWRAEEAGPISGRVRAMAQMIPGQQKATATAAEFRELVARARLTGEVPVFRGRPVPEALEAGKRWDAEIWEPLHEMGAAAGLILDGRHKHLADAALARQGQGLKARVDEINKALTDDTMPPELRARWDAEARQAKAEGEALQDRIDALGEAGTGRTTAYMPHRWIPAKVREGRERLVGILEREWAGQIEEARGWATAAVRAEIAVSHLLGEGIADTMERALARHWRQTGLSEVDAKARAAAAAAPVRVREQATAPDAWKAEVASALGRTLGTDQAETGLWSLIHKELKTTGIATADMVKLTDALAGVPQGTNKNPMEEWADNYKPAASRRRSIDVPTKLIADFIDLNQTAVAGSYLRFMGPAIETAKAHGDPGSLNRMGMLRIDTLRAIQRGEDGATLAELDAMDQAGRDMRGLVQGSLIVPENPDAYSLRVLRSLANFAVVTQMGRSLFANLGDVGRGVMAVGFRRALGGALDAAAGNRARWKLGGDEAAKAGAALEMSTLATVRAREDMGAIGADVTWGERMLDAGAQQMQFLNGVAPWTEMTQRFFGAMVQSDMIELSVKLTDGIISRADRTRLNALGIDKAQAAAIKAEWLSAGGEKSNKLFLANTDAWASPALRDKFRAQLTTAMDSTIIRPGAADRPKFMTAPLGQVLLMYRGFGLASTQRMVMAGMQARDMRTLSGALSSIAIAWIVGGASGGANDEHPILSWERLYGAVERSGTMGLLSDVNVAAETLSGNTAGLRPLLGLEAPSYAKDPNWAQRAGVVAGPALAPFLNLTWAMTSPEATGSNVAGAIRRAIPFNNLLWLNDAFGSLSREAGSALTPDAVAQGSRAGALPGYLGG